MSFLKKYAAIFFFAFFLIVGLFSVDHYGMSWDEDMEHLTSYVQYKYALGKLHIAELEDYEQLWRDFGGEKYYGQAISFPLVAIEHLFNFQLDTRSVYFIRHTYNFLIFWGAGIFLFLALKNMFSSRKTAFFGTLLWFLCPRFWGESFYNNKDLLFCSLMMMSMSCCYLWSRGHRWRIGILWALLTALMVNLRIIGLLAVAAEGIYLLIATGIVAKIVSMFLLKACDLRQQISQTLFRHSCRKKSAPEIRSVLNFCQPFCGKKVSSPRDVGSILRVLFQLFCCAILFYVFYIAIFPTAWRDPFGIFFDVYRLMSNYPMGMNLIFLGQSIHNTALPWYYIPLYFFATMPIFFSALFLAATAFLIKNFRLLRRHLFFILCLLMAVGAIILEVITDAPIYNGWRHFYFIFVPLVFVMAYAISIFLTKLPRLGSAVLSFCFALIALQMIFIHPYEYLYFNPVAAQFVPGNFERDYWGVSGRAALDYILAHHPEQKNMDTAAISAPLIIMTNTKGTYLAPALMPRSEREQLNVIYLTDEPVATSASYIVYNYTNDRDNLWVKDGWQEIASKSLGNYKVWSIYARQK